MRKPDSISKPPRKQRPRLRLVKPPPPAPAAGPANPPTLSLAEWAPLDEAFQRLKTALHSSALAQHEIVKYLRGEELPSAVRILSRDGTDTFQHLQGRDWQGHRVEESPVRDPTGEPTGEWVARVPTAPLRFGSSRVWFFVLRRALDNLCPSGPVEQAEAPPTGRRRGRRPTHDWHLVVAAELIRIAKAGEPDPTAQEMIEYCERELPGAYSPGLKEMQRVLRRLLFPL